MGYGVSKFAPYYGVGSYSGFGDVYDANSNKWYSGVSIFADDCSSTTNWTADEANGGTASTISSVNGELKIISNGATFGGASKAISTIIGKKYVVIVTNTSMSLTSSFIRVGTTQRGYDILAQSWSSAGSYKFSFVASTATTWIFIGIGGTATAGSISTWDNIAVYPIKDDGTPDLSAGTEITNSRNYLDAIVYGDTSGNAEYIEQLPKTVYYDRVKANRYEGKNACTAWVNFDGTTTPPTIRDSLNVSSVVRTSTGQYDVYFTTPMDNANYGIGDSIGYSGSANIGGGADSYSLTKFRFMTYRDISTPFNNGYTTITVFGGRN